MAAAFAAKSLHQTGMAPIRKNKEKTIKCWTSAIDLNRFSFGVKQHQYANILNKSHRKSMDMLQTCLTNYGQMLSLHQATYLLRVARATAWVALTLPLMKSAKPRRSSLRRCNATSQSSLGVAEKSKRRETLCAKLTFLVKGTSSTA